MQVELNKEELEMLMNKAKGELADLDEEDNEDGEDEEKEEMEDDDEDGKDDSAAAEPATEDKEMTEDERIAKEYGMDDYDDGMTLQYSKYLKANNSASSFLHI